MSDSHRSLPCRLLALLLMLVLLCAAVPASAVQPVRIYSQPDYTAPEWSIAGYSGRSLATSGCILFTYAHAIEWLTGTTRGVDLIRELLNVCSDPNGFYGHTRCTHSNKGNQSALAYRNYVASKYHITWSSFTRSEANFKTALDAGNVVILSGLS